MSQENLKQKILKNSVYNFLTGLVTKIGGLIFTILLARFLLPELFGIYNLVLSIILISMVFCDLGVGSASIRYVSEKLGEKNKKSARSFFRYLLKLKIILVFIVILILFFISKFLAYDIFDKPLVFYPLLASTLYIFSLSISNLFKSLFISLKDLKKYFFIELFFEIFKIIFVILAIYVLSQGFIVSGIFIAMSLATLSALIFNLFLLSKDIDLVFGKIEKIQRKRLFNYIGSMSIVGISFTIFGAVDTLMLGRFVNAEYIGYYRAALSIVYAVAALFGLSSVLLPIFTQLHGKVKIAFKKAARYILMFCIPSCLGIIFISKYFILAIYGKEYILASSVLYFLSLMIIITPLIALYTSVFQAKEKTNILAKATVLSLLLNIILNYLLIKYLLNISQEYAIIGAAIATVFSRLFYLLFLGIKSKQIFKTNIDLYPTLKQLFAGIIMVIGIIGFSNIFDMNIYLGIIEIFFGAFVYFTVLWLVKGITKEDIDLTKGVLKIKKKN